MKLLPIGKTASTKVDDQDFPHLSKFKWYFRSNKRCPHLYYACTHINRKTVSLHRLLLNPPSNQYVDHINGDGLDNRRCNLRIATQSENMRNQKRHRDSAYQFKGVWKVKNCARWVARIWDGKKRHYLGIFKTPEAAAKTYDEKARELFGQFAKLNFSTETGS